MSVEEKYNVSPWLVDDSDKQKCFSLAGFFPNPNEPASAETMEKLKTDIIAKLEELGGKYIDSDAWDNRITHVIAHVDEKNNGGLSEKVMGAIASGKWVLTKRYVEKSHKAKCFISSPQVFAWPREAVVSSRRRYHDAEDRSRGGMFHGMKAVTVMPDERKRGVYRRILLAGGANCYDHVNSLRQLLMSDLLTERGNLTHVFMEQSQTKDEYLKKILEKKPNSVHVQFLNFKYIFARIKGNIVQDFNLGKRNRKADVGRKRQITSPEADRSNKKPKQDVPLVTVSDSESDREDGELVDDDDDDCMVVEDNTQKPVRDINSISDNNNGVEQIDSESDYEDDDDDIVVLNQRLKESQVSSGRLYTDKEKAKAVPKLKAAAEVEMIDLDDDEEDEIMEVEQERCKSPDVMEIDQDDREDVSDDDDAETVLDNLDKTLSSLVPGELQLPVDLAPSIDVIDEDQTPEFSDEDEERSPVYDEPVEPSIDDCLPVPVQPPSPDVLYHEAVEPSLLEVEAVVFKEKQERVEKSIRDAIEKLNNDYSDLQETGKVVELNETLPKKNSSRTSQPSGNKSSSLFSQQLKKKEQELADVADVVVDKETEFEKSSATPSGIYVSVKSSPPEKPICDKNTLSSNLNSKVEKVKVSKKSPTPEKKLDNLEMLKMLQEIKPVNEKKKETKVDTNVQTKINRPEKTAEDIKPVEDPLPQVKTSSSKSDSMLNRIIATLQRRMSITDEGISISLINTRTVKFDKHGERRLRRGGQVRQVDPGVVQDFVETLNEDGDLNMRPNGARLRDESSASSGLLKKSYSSSNAITVLRRLEMETSSTCQPSSFLLNCIMTGLLLYQREVNVRTMACQYLNKFLFLHLNNPDRMKWLSLFLGSCRECPDEKSYRNFNLSNIHDLQSCWTFFSNVVTHIHLKLQEDGDEDEVCLFLEMFVKILHKDFDSWWKHWRNKDATSQLSQKNYPAIFYLLGGSKSTILPNIKSSILLLYKWTLANHGRMSGTVRKLVSMSGLLLSYLDTCQDQSLVTRGGKVEFANTIATMMTQSQLATRDVQLELGLLQPSWLSAAVSRQLLTSVHNVDVSGQGVPGLLSQMSSSSSPMSPDLRIILDNYFYKLCSYQHSHTIFRANWHHVRSKEKDFRVFKMMNKLEDKGVVVHNKMVKFEEISVKQSNIIETVNLIRDFANNNRDHLDKTDQTGLASLFFKMSFVDRF